MPPGIDGAGSDDRVERGQFEWTSEMTATRIGRSG
jgi:hypothetical protein